MWGRRQRAEIVCRQTARDRDPATRSHRRTGACYPDSWVSPASNEEDPAMTDQSASGTIERSPSHRFLPPVALGPGDRFPNFILPDQSGQARSFLERANGSTLLIVAD